MLHNHLVMFKKRENIVEIEEGKLLSPKFDNDGLIPVITMCSKTKDVLMHGYMNVEAFKKTIETKEAHYFSRSRQQIWHKGKTSGFTQKVTEIRIDDDNELFELIDKVKILNPENYLEDITEDDYSEEEHLLNLQNELIEEEGEAPIENIVEEKKEESEIINNEDKENYSVYDKTEEMVKNNSVENIMVFTKNGDK